MLTPAAAFWTLAIFGILFAGILHGAPETTIETYDHDYDLIMDDYNTQTTSTYF